jgi:hypothetical protein
MTTSTLMAISQSYKSIYPLDVFGISVTAYAGIFAVVANLAVAIVLTVVLRAAGQVDRGDDTVAPDYVEDIAAPAADERVPVLASQR